ncbi:DNA ligase 1 [Liparis tanakae]|uniref:DNA ligase 1 n=1 Tax=Liparis tanakae TaxID=230148 RepID=A0A4Z2ECM5_9TELE|nr:DNA ligase 1 [Liparis tanakae]
MQRSIASFFQPKCKDKAVEKKAAHEPLKKPVKSPLKVQNGAREADSPVRKVARRSRQILDSDEDEDEEEEQKPVKEEVASEPRGDKAALDKKEKVTPTYNQVHAGPVPTPTYNQVHAGPVPTPTYNPGACWSCTYSHI